MTIHMRPYAGPADLQRILDLKRACTTPENRYDAPTHSELRALLAPLPQDPSAERPPWKDEQGRVIGHLYRRAMTQQATMLWMEADGTPVAYALIAPPSIVLTFQVHPQAHSSGLETQILAWAIAGAQEQARQRGRTFSLWCRCHERETERRALLGGGGFQTASGARSAPGSPARYPPASGSLASRLCFARWRVWEGVGAVPGTAPGSV